MCPCCEATHICIVYYTRAVRKVSSHSEYVEIRSHGLDITLHPVRGDLTVHLWTVTWASQAAVRPQWLSLCIVWLFHSQWPSEQISFITIMHLPILQLSCRLFIAKRHITHICQPSYSPDLAPCDFWLFPKLKSPLKGGRFVNATVTQYTSSVNGVSLPTD
jgi:hypothetical protein